MGRDELQCTVHPVGYLKTYTYVVVCTFLDGRPVLSRHEARNTWETQGGHIEENETPLEAARRELYEESGIEDAELFPVCDYYGYDKNGHANGRVFAARAHTLGSVPPFEMKEVRVFDTLPDDLTYPNVTPKLFAEAQKALHIQNTPPATAMELPERIARITEMEETRKEATAAVLGLLEALEKYKAAPLQKLFDYYFGPQWMEDYLADGRGEVPRELPRGVLAQDTVYDLFTDDRRLRDMIKELLQEEDAPPG